MLHLVAEQSKLKFWQDEFGMFLGRRRGVKRGGGAFRTGGRGDCVHVDIHLSSKSGEVDITATTMTSHLRDIYGGFDPFWQPLGSVATVWFGQYENGNSDQLSALFLLYSSTQALIGVMMSKLKIHEVRFSYVRYKDSCDE